LKVGSLTTFIIVYILDRSAKHTPLLLHGDLFAFDFFYYFFTDENRYITTQNYKYNKNIPKTKNAFED